MEQLVKSTTDSGVTSLFGSAKWEQYKAEIRKDEMEYLSNLYRQVETQINNKWMYRVPFTVYEITQHIRNLRQDFNLEPKKVWGLIEKYIEKNPSLGFEKRLVNGYFVYCPENSLLWYLPESIKQIFNLKPQRKYEMGYKKLDEVDVQKVLRRLVYNKQLFSHYDVVHLLREEGFYTRLLDVKNIISKMVTDGTDDGIFKGYDKAVYYPAASTGIPGGFNVYKPTYESVNNYNLDLDKFAGTLKVQPDLSPKQPVALLPASPVVSVPVVKQKKVSKDNRFRISAKKVRELGYKPGDKVCIYRERRHDDSSFLVPRKLGYQGVIPANVSKQWIVVDKNCNIRFTPPYKAEFDLKPTYSCWGIIRKKSS